MLSTVEKIGTITDKYMLPLTIFKFSKKYVDKLGRKTYYLVGSFFQETPIPAVALFLCNESGTIMDSTPSILEEGVRNFEELFKNEGWTLIS